MACVMDGDILLPDVRSNILLIFFLRSVLTCVRARARLTLNLIFQMHKIRTIAGARSNTVQTKMRV